MTFKTLLEDEGKTLDDVVQSIRDSMTFTDKDDQYIDYIYNNGVSKNCISIIYNGKLNSACFSKTHGYNGGDPITASIYIKNITTDEAVNYLKIIENMVINH